MVSRTLSAKDIFAIVRHADGQLGYGFRTGAMQEPLCRPTGVEHVLKFWFGLKPGNGGKAARSLDHRIKQHFLKLWAEKRQLPVEAFLDDPLTAIAAVILFDQFPRNMFRGHADQFATDPSRPGDRQGRRRPKA